MTGYPAGWSVAAARAAITTETPVLLTLLDDPDPAIRIDAAYALATAADLERTVRTAFATRLATEHDAVVVVALLLAAPRPPAPTRSRRSLVDPRAVAGPDTGPRLAAAVGWLRLTDEPARADLRHTIDVLATDERAQAMEALPWMTAAAGSDEPGLLRCVRRMFHLEQPEPDDDPWPACSEQRVTAALGRAARVVHRSCLRCQVAWTVTPV
ncbi:hypothetical protein [Streptomyces sp. CB03578]|uniref:hypothetical protein n=1 Tax=Streptomyces sp. CB03578 TaxID=1718987 RepID=UPI001F524A3B|nr:hypothetical protein [Streptomyces sp. CB03578]